MTMRQTMLEHDVTIVQ